MWVVGYAPTVEMNLLSPSSALTVEPVCFSETFSPVYQTTRHHRPKDSNFNYNIKGK
jgi:hypothetical protein